MTFSPSWLKSALPRKVLICLIICCCCGADLIEAATFPNPKFDLAIRFPDKPPSGTYIDYGAAIDFLSIIMIPLKKQVANRLLGLWDADTDWQIAGDLPEVPSSDIPMRALERLAISQRLDLQADYLQVTSQVKNLGLTKSLRLVGPLDFGFNSECDGDGEF